MRPHIDPHQETLLPDGNALMRWEGVLRTSQPVGYPRQGECGANRETIEAIIMESVTERTREYIVRRIRDGHR